MGQGGVQRGCRPAAALAHVPTLMPYLAVLLTHAPIQVIRATAAI